ncbi:hypothetical protein [uncultured Hyphomicrobium sp.]|uniref:hypothetical protein n=1 Tax=uncultured Hyphomicrobium sp. TaxID=194373 RepID=UPI0025E38176|nr:hypothetical protein [uncultured Hyphomicrobium sp.]
MKSISLALLTATLVAFSAPAFAAKPDCDAGYKDFLSKMSVYVDKMTGYELADAVRKSLDAYNSCAAGDNFSPHGVWDQIINDMKTKSGK